MSEARTGPPPEKREPRPVERTAHLENTGNWNGANNITDADNWSSDDDLLMPWDWGGYTGFVVVMSGHTKSLIAAGVLAWIIVELFCIDDEKDWSAYPDLEFASQALQEPFNAPCAAVARGKDAERRDEEQAGTRAAGVQIEAERGREFA